MANLTQGKGHRTDLKILPLSIHDTKGLPDLHVIPFLKGVQLNKHDAYMFTVDIYLEPTN